MDLDELKAKYGVTQTSEKPSVDKPKFSKRRTWLNPNDTQNPDEQVVDESISQTSSNLVQNEFITGSQTSSNLVQNEFITGSIKIDQKDEKIRTSSEIGSQLVHELVQNRFTTGSDLNKINVSLPVRGTQQKILKLLFELSTSSGDLTTPPLPSDIFLKALKIGSESARTAVKRLIKNGHIKRIDFGRGRAGWTRYAVSHSTYKKLLSEHQTGSQLVHNWFVTGAQTGSETGSNAPSSSSSYVLEDFKTTTTDQIKTVGINPLQLSKEWLEIDYSALSEIHFGQPQLSQIAQLEKLTPTEVQDSIDAFAFDLKRNQRASGLKTSPLNFFMGILRRGMPYTPPENYESPEDEARRKYLEAKRTQTARRQAMEKEIIELEFQEWNEGLTANQRKELAPHAKIDKSEMQISVLREYFLNHVYSQHQSESLQSIRRQIDQSLGSASTGEGVVSQ